MSRPADKHDRLIQVLIVSRSVTDAAEKSGVSARHIWRLLGDAAFKARYREAARSHLEHTSGAIQASMMQAVSTLRNVMNDPHAMPAARVAAARVILEIGFRAVDSYDFDQRVENLERKAGIIL